MICRRSMRGLSAAIVLAIVAGCAQSATTPASSPSSSSCGSQSVAGNPRASEAGNLLIIGRILTMDEPPIAEAVLVEDGAVVAVGGRAELSELACDDVPVIDLGQSVAYPGFIDAHAHWIGDRDRYGIRSPEEAMDAAISRGWTSISEQWVNPQRLLELETLAADGAMPFRVDAYLALNYATAFLGDWYVDREPGPVGDHLRVRGLKIHLDDGPGKIINWEPAELTATIGRANEAGWQISVHSVSAAALDLALDAFEASIGPTGPNPLHHRIEHLIQVTDDQLARVVAMDIAAVIHLDGAADWILDPRVLAEFDRDDPGEAAELLARWRDLVDAGLHVASATDAPWTFEDGLVDDIGRPFDQIAAGMDGRVRTRPDTPDWLLDQLLTAEQGLRAVTSDAAWAVGDEERRGHLAPGALGDVTILSGDVTSATPDEIRAMDVVATIVGGTVIHCSDAEVCGKD